VRVSVQRCNELSILAATETGRLFVEGISKAPIGVSPQDSFHELAVR
jgi:hypothetical protein